MFQKDKVDYSKDKAAILSIINSEKFKSLFINSGITNVIIFGSLADGEFTVESDVDIAIIAKASITFNDEQSFCNPTSRRNGVQDHCYRYGYRSKD